MLMPPLQGSQPWWTKRDRTPAGRGGGPRGARRRPRSGGGGGGGWRQRPISPGPGAPAFGAFTHVEIIG
jgi:hypothetical protein